MRIISDFTADLRVSARGVRKAPLAFTVAVGSLAVGLAASALVIGIAYALVSRQRVNEHERSLVRIFATSPEGCASCIDGFSSAAFRSWQDAGFRSLRAAALLRQVSVVDDEEPHRRVAVTYVDDEFFRLVGVRPALGRLPARESPDEAVASHALWRSRFGADEAIVGRQIDVGALRVRIVGVMPRDFRIPEDADLWLSRLGDAAWDRADVRDRTAIARLNPGTTPDAADTELRVAARRHAELVDRTEEGRGAVVLPPAAWPGRGVAASGAWAVVGAVLGVFWLCLLNLSSLHHARILAREREFAVRKALGASASRLRRQLAAEGLVVGAAGIVLGILLYQLLWVRAGTYVLDTFGVELSVVSEAFTMAVIVVIGVVANLLTALPAMLRVGGAPSHDMLRGSAQTSRPQRRARSTLVIGQVSAVFALVAGASLMLRSFMTTYRTESGLDDRSSYVMELLFDGQPEASDPAMRTELVLASAAAAIPGSRVALWSSKGIDPTNPRLVVLNASGRGDVYSAPGAVGWERPYPSTSVSITSEGFAILGLRVVDGRAFTVSDTRGSESVAIVNEMAAAVLWPGERAVGQQIRVGGAHSGEPLLTVIGVVGNSVHPLRLGLSQTLVTQGRLPAILFRPYGQDPSSPVVLAVRPPDMSAAPSTVSAALRRTLPEGIRMIGPAAVMREWMASDGRIQRVRSAARILSAAALAGLLIALLGVYGLVAEAVQSRVREFALRMALGSTPGGIVTLVGLQLLRLVSVAVVIGALASIAVARLGTTVLYGYHEEIRTGLVYGTSASDPSIYAAAVFAVSIVAALGAIFPVLRAVRVSPAEVLRSD